MPFQDRPLSNDERTQLQVVAVELSIYVKQLRSATTHLEVGTAIAQILARLNIEPHNVSLR